MPLISDFVRRMKEKKALKEGYSQERYVEDDYAQRKLSSNEREYMRYQEEDREKRIKQALEHRRKIESKKTWSGQEGNPAYAKNVISKQKNLFSGKNMFSSVPDVVAQPNLFKRKDLFFKGGI